MNDKIILSVSQLNFYIKSLFDSDSKLNDLLIQGEISNFTDHYKSGHLYFSLKDENSVVKAVMFSGNTKRLRFMPENGMKVIVRAKASLYEVSGQYQLYVEDMQPDGIGALSLAFEQLKDKLKKEGLFNTSIKKTIPKYPKKIGVVTSDTGAAIKDIENILSRRYPIAEVILCPVLVQGEGAPRQIVDAIQRFNSIKACDVMIVGRGGGSIEDLWAFNDERVARAIYESEIPIISAVGHETDFTISDFVADLRAPTPSAAAELAVPNINDIYAEIDSYVLSLNKEITYILENYKTDLSILSNTLKNKNPEKIIEEKRLRLDIIYSELLKAFNNKLSLYKDKFVKLNSKLNMLSPLKVLSMGYTIAISSAGKSIKSVNDTEINENLILKMFDGEIDCIVKNKKICSERR